MDMRIFSKFVMALGVAVMLFGAFTINDAIDAKRGYAVKFGESKLAQTKSDGPSYITGEQSEFLYEMKKAEEREKDSVYFVLAGCVVLFLGVGVFMSSRRPHFKAEA